MVLCLRLELGLGQGQDRWVFGMVRVRSLMSMNVLIKLYVCVLCIKDHNHLSEVDIKGTVFSFLGLSGADRDPFMPTESASKNAFGMLNRSK